MEQEIYQKLTILAAAAKYDVSCSSSGSDKKGVKGLGSTSCAGICHTWGADGRCISLLKILMTNHCIYDCAYCLNRVTNDIARASFTPEEVVTLTMEFYRRNYIEGLFLSSAIEKNANATMERIVQVLSLLRHRERFGGYIHVKAIPGADAKLIHEAGLLADRMSVNIELATEEGLRLLAPQKKLEKLFLPMQQIKEEKMQIKEDKTKYRYTPDFVPAGQSTQMIIGATTETDRQILGRSDFLYQNYDMKRVYYSAYVPINAGENLPALQTAPPMVREHRIYQADWLLRYYSFGVDEILPETAANLDLEIDPKMMWALRNMNFFPVELNRASYSELLRIPGIGPLSARKITKQRKYAAITEHNVTKLGISLKKARYFITCNGKYLGGSQVPEPERLRSLVAPPPAYEQLSLGI
ncbi:putative DNA modification/repair radical SAM protein [Clostridiales bacterium COT073_COT-073]|nr:putative DNA modification/repair radical SAM protein [Clostridiales bacterium COT073_COT-073]